MRLLLRLGRDGGRRRRRGPGEMGAGSLTLATAPHLRQERDGATGGAGYHVAVAPKLEVVSVVDAVIADLRRRMFSGDLPPGAPLTEATVAATYDVARTTAKAAIESLVGERLLVRNAHKTARVVTLDADDVRDVYRTRALIEGQVVRTLADQKRVPDAARLALDEMHALTDADPERIVAPDMRFHRALVDALGSARTSRAYEALASEVVLCMSHVQGAALLPTADIVSEHEEILRRIVDGDAAGAAAAVHDHLGRASDRLAALVESRPAETR